MKKWKRIDFSVHFMRATETLVFFMPCASNSAVMSKRWRRVLVAVNQQRKLLLNLPFFPSKYIAKMFRSTVPLQHLVTEDFFKLNLYHFVHGGCCCIISSSAVRLCECGNCICNTCCIAGRLKIILRLICGANA